LTYKQGLVQQNLPDPVK